MVETTKLAMQLIAGAGESKGYAFDALSSMNEGNFEEAQNLLNQAQKASLPAHKEQMGMIKAMASGEDVPVSILMVHAQDHLMSSELAQDLIRELLVLYKRVDTLEREIKELKGVI